MELVLCGQHVSLLVNQPANSARGLVWRQPALATPDRALLVTTLPALTNSLIWAWCMAARSCQMLVAIEVPKAPPEHVQVGQT
ncbi:MAG: hypothetical protein ABIR35_04585 [Polaromonas sp.]